MIGAIIGDIVGSRFEHTSFKGKEFDLFTNSCRFTDDTIMSLAVAKSIIESKEDKSDLEQKVINNMSELGKKYIHAGYGKSFKNWILSNEHTPYNSFGNGAAMRVSACGYLASLLNEAIKYSTIVTNVTHNHIESVSAANTIAACIYLLKTGSSKDDIRKYVEENYVKLDFTIDEIRESYSFHVSCRNTVPQAIEAFLEGNDFEDVIRNAISIGGDTDTIAAIAGSIAEAYYEVPNDIKEKALSYLTSDLRNIYDKYQIEYNSLNRNVYSDINEKNIINLFKNFWNKLSNTDSETYTLLINELSNIDINNQKDIDNFEYFIIDTNDEDIRLLVLQFYKYLLKHNIYINSNLNNYRLYKGDTTARRIDILKMIQTKVSRDDLVKRYNVNPKTIRNDINALRNGTKILATKIRLSDKLKEETEGNKVFYECTDAVNPIFLLLNSTESYAMTNTIEHSLKKDKILDYDNSCIKNVINVIKNQLSDYAIESLYINVYKNDNFYFNKEDRMLSYGIGRIDELIKSRKKCKFTIYDEEFIGFFTYDGIVIETDEGFKSINIPHKDVIYKEI